MFGGLGCSTFGEVEQTPLCSESSVVGREPGLAVRYYKGFFRYVKEMPQGKAAQRWGRRGNPIPMLNHQFGKGNVFDSGLSQGVGVMMKGFIHFSNPGLYQFKAKSNDGVRIIINDQVVVSDEDVHSDRYSLPGVVDVKTPCWYPLVVKYFQRKGTAMIALYWKKPGESSFSIVPAEAYAHIPQ